MLKSLPDPALISVIIPTYNRAELLKKAIASVCAQTYSQWELIIVDDGSTDDTVALIDSCEDSRVRLVAMPHGGNVALLRNAGVAAGSGAWLAFLDSDDEWVHNKLEIQLQALMAKDECWSYGGYEVIDNDSRTIASRSGKYRPVSGWIIAPLLSTGVAVNIGSLMLTKNLFNKVGGFNEEPKLIYREDYELALRLALNAEALALPAVLVRVREHARRSTNECDDGHERTVYVYKHFLNLQPPNKFKTPARRRMAHHLAEIAVNQLRKGKYFSAIAYLQKAIVNGDSWRHLLSTARRGLSSRSKN